MQPADLDDQIDELTRYFLDMEAHTRDWEWCLDSIPPDEAMAILAQLEAPGAPAYLGRMAKALREHMSTPTPEDRRSRLHVVKP